ncbi:MAG: inorganic phosphate transporter [Planctomycetaceae bacterium]|nr:inorganic phosphate transporter [Planctomycetaceae bacterium]
MDRQWIWGSLALSFVVWGLAYTGYHIGTLDAPALVIGAILLALAFDFTNGIHDAANSIATVVSTRVLTPLQAVVWAAFFNFVAAYVFSTEVATTIGKGIVDKEVVDTYFVLSALLGAILWNLITWYLGLPTSSSHALIGAMTGAAIAKAGVKAVIFSGVLKIAAFIVLSPMIGLVLGFVMGTGMTWIVRNATPRRVDAIFRKGQLLSAALYSLGHGSNDAQKTMGIIAMLLYSTVWKTRHFQIDPWIKLICYTAMGMGTLIGGWRIVKTMGSRITKLDPFGGFCAESGAAVTLFATAAAGIPVSTTHTIAGSIVGFGAMRRLSAVRWGVTVDIVWAWIFTIPVAAVIGSLSYLAVATIAKCLH